MNNSMIVADTNNGIQSGIQSTIVSNTSRRKLQVTMDGFDSALLTPQLDAMMIGGASIFAFFLFHLLIDRSTSVYTVSWTTYYLQVIVNFPHFMLSYFLLYRDHRAQLFRRPRFLVAGLLIPVMLASILAYIAYWSDAKAAGWLINAMFFLVGWHYVKQIFGTMVVTSALRGFYFKGTERLGLLVSLYSIWALYWISVNSMAATHQHLGVAYTTFALPDWVIHVAYPVSMLASLMFVVLMLYKYVREGVTLPAAAVLSYLSIQLWYIPAFHHPAYFYVIPLLHSLQYLPFVFAFKRNQVRESLKELRDVEYRWGFLKSFWGYLLLSVPAGVVAFWLAPHLLDGVVFYNKELLGPTYFVAMVNVFINIHHYFIDNVIWKGDNPEVRRYLFQKS